MFTYQHSTYENKSDHDVMDNHVMYELPAALREKQLHSKSARPRVAIRACEFIIHDCTTGFKLCCVVSLVHMECDAR